MRVRPKQKSTSLLQESHPPAPHRKCSCPVNKYVNLISYNTSMVALKGVSHVSSRNLYLQTGPPQHCADDYEALRKSYKIRLSWSENDKQVVVNFGDSTQMNFDVV